MEVLDGSNVLPWDSDAFTVAVASLCLHHVPAGQHRGLLGELLRVAPVVIIHEEDPCMNWWCRMLNSQIFTHADAHFSLEDWVERLRSFELPCTVESNALNGSEFTLTLRVPADEHEL